MLEKIIKSIIKINNNIFWKNSSIFEWTRLIFEPIISPCPEDSECEDTVGSFICICKQGYKFDGKNCIDIDECTEETHSCSQTQICENSVGSFECSCSKGFEKVDKEGDCEDVDECLDENICPGNSQLKSQNQLRL